MSANAEQVRSPLIEQFRFGLKPEQLRRALNDILDGWRRRELWATLGLHDIRQRYRRSTLGPFWITISMGVMVFALGLLYGQIFGQDLHEYLPFLAAGFVIWGLVSSMILGGCQAFIAAEGMIKQLNAPVSIYGYREVWSALIAFAHNIWIFLAVAWWYDVGLSWQVLWVLPAVLILVINGFWMALFFGLLSARFRDVPLIVGSVVQVLFFLTPVIWRPEMLPDRALFLQLNPFYHMVEILRAPMLGQAPLLENWLAVIAIAVFGWAITLFFYSAYRWRIAYWV
ncbi:ABC transporter permease [Thiocapsa rosea]|uniref:ABC-2 type transport system permease protein/lipopolysaccharide transport system permease protein n=1 Tax=Thiocapsa rosea TaxID=69360 RepID=A0A495V712_9GAMM|nr:ABC transporter permease [Thiocapsa rosea]RKT44490.1 ABC-2 type transport system permease protein/lipopolysaccharide transport system permease protein [Thiocapsa rosea]